MVNLKDKKQSVKTQTLRKCAPNHDTENIEMDAMQKAKALTLR